MASRSPFGYDLRFGPGLTPVVRLLLLANAAVFLLQFFTHTFFSSFLWEGVFALHSDALTSGKIWQFLTYAFLHGDFFHLLFNLLALWMFGSELENYWGEKTFLSFYLVSAVGGGLLSWIGGFLGLSQGVVLGASGAIYGLLVAFALVWPNREILFMMIFPLKAKYFVMILMLMIAFAQGGRVAHMAHLGGALAGLAYFQLFLRNRSLSGGGSSWSLSRYLQKRRFQRYQKEMHQRTHAKEEVDRLLDKISKSGMNSLSRSEKKFLNEASKKYFND